MFRRRRNKKAEAASVAAEPTPVETGPAPFEIGKNGSVEQFREANQRAVDMLDERASWDKEGQYLKYLGANDQKQLRKGAVEAFKEGHPENIQTALLYSDEFAIHDGYLSVYRQYPEDTRTSIVSDLINAGNDPSAVINLALLAQAAEDKKQDMLDSILVRAARGVIPGGNAFMAALLKAGANPLPVAIRNIMLENVDQDKKTEKMNDLLLRTIRKEITGGEVFIAGLLDAGADANVAVEDYKGIPLIHAVQYDQPLSVIENIFNKGANFDDAIDSMKMRGYEGEMVRGADGENSVKGTYVLNRMKALKEHFTGVPAKAEVDPKEQQQLLDDLAAAKEEITKLTARLAETSAPAAIRQPLRLGVRHAGPG